MSYDLIKIKEKYGEQMMHLCRKLFPTLLEKEGLLFEIMNSEFAFSKYLYDDIINNSLEQEFKNYIYSLVFTNYEITKVEKTPYELMDIAGYDLHECNSEEEIMAFSKYYAEDEKLCTFKGGRLDMCYVFFAVKKNVQEIKREDFIEPTRQDEYGTSVISIQFTKGHTNTLSIKNRYNHTVPNPDATFSNCLENIIPGLTHSFEKMFDLKISQNNKNYFEIPGYVRANNGKLYKYNYEINNTYYCPNNIIIDNFKVIDTFKEKEKYLIIDYFIVDLIKKRVYLYDQTLEDAFVDDLQENKKITIKKDKDTKNKILNIILNNDEEVIIEIDKFNRIISYTNNATTTIGNNFLYKNKTLKRISLNNVRYIKDRFLCCNTSLNEININNVLEIGDVFLSSNLQLSTIYLPNVTQIGNRFLERNIILMSITAPNLKMVKNKFLEHNKNLRTLSLENLIYVQNDFLYYNIHLEELNCPNLKVVGDCFLFNNLYINKICLDNLISVGSCFLSNNQSLTELTLNKLEKIHNHFLGRNNTLLTFSAPNLKSIGDYFLYKNTCMNKINIPNIIIIGNNFLYNNKSITNLYLQYLISVGHDFLYFNKVLNEIYVPNLKHAGNNFLYSKTWLEKYDLLSLNDAGVYLKFLVKDVKRKVLRK